MENVLLHYHTKGKSIVKAVQKDFVQDCKAVKFLTLPNPVIECQ